MHPTDNSGRWTWIKVLSLMPPGLFLLATIMLVATSVACGGDAQRAGEQALATLRNVTSDLGLALFLVVAAYLIGVVIQAVGVNRADRICGSLFGWMAGDDFTKKLYQDRFPYLPILRAILAGVQENGRAAGVLLPTPRTAHTMFNMWKVELADLKPNAFALLRDLESRVRLFAGLFWAGFWGVLLTAVGMAVCAALQGTGWAACQVILLSQLAVSVFLLGVFGWRLRIVRGQEVEYLFLATLRVWEEAASALAPVGASVVLPTCSNGKHIQPAPSGGN